MEDLDKYGKGQEGQNGDIAKVVDFANVAHSITETYERKNHDYGDSFSRTFEEFGIIAAVVRMNDKMNRIKTLAKDEAHINGESMQDTLADLAGYCIMTIMELNKHKRRRIVENALNAETNG